MPIPLVTRVLIADDFPIVRSGLRKLLDAKPDFEVVAEAEDGGEAVD
jgi:YesN/AraC family two-component response regulator